MPIVYKWNKKLRCISGDCKTFFNDIRYIGAMWELCCVATQQVETMMGYLGLQDATRKMLPITQSPREWTVAILRTI